MPAIARWWLLMEGAGLLLVIGIAVWGYFRWDRRYHGSSSAAGGFERTEETFTDPTTGAAMRVFFNPSTGQRQYRPD